MSAAALAESDRSGPVRVFICDDVPELRELVRARLELGGAIAVVGEAGSGRAGVSGVAATQPDVVVLDLSLPDMDGLEALPRMKRAAPDVRVVVFSGFARARVEPRAIALGADAYVEKAESVKHLRDVILSLER